MPLGTLGVSFMIISHTALRGSLGLAVAGILIAAAPASAQTYSQNFDSGTAPGFTLNGLWHVSSNDPESPGYDLAFTQNETPDQQAPDGNYEGLWDSTAFSSLISLGAGAHSLDLDAVNFNEIGDGPDYYDRLRIGVSLDGSSYAILASTSTFDGAPTYFAPSSPGDPYQHLTLDLSAYAGQNIYLAFNYSTLDSGDNDHAGARIDNIAVDGVVREAVPEPASWALMLGGFGMIGGALRRRRAAVSFA